MQLKQGYITLKDLSVWFGLKPDSISKNGGSRLYCGVEISLYIYIYKTQKLRHNTSLRLDERSIGL